MATRKLPKKETLGRYRIIREIGRGGSGVVYEGWDPRHGRQVALKVLPAIRALDPERVERFLREARNARHLDHEHIISLYEIGEERGTYFLVMQYVEGRPLDVFWKEELIDFREAVNVVLQCLEALEYAHDRGLAHLDVKPQNILVDSRGKAFLTDFGLAQGASVDSRGRTVVGTPKYMSPEQASGSSSVNFRSDIYSLGVTLYNLLTYTHPFEGDDVHIILKNVISGDFIRPRDINNHIPARLEAIVLKAMERKPGRRYSSDAEFRDDLENYLKGESVTASVPIMKRRGLRLLWSRKILYGLLILAVTSVGVLIALEFLVPKGPRGRGPDTEDPTRRKEARDLSAEGDGHFSRGNLDEALQAYDRALELMPRDPITLVKRGQIFAMRSAPQRAEADFAKAIEWKSDFSLAWLSRGQVRIERRNLDGASADLGRALDILRGRSEDPNTPELLSKTLTALGQVSLLIGEMAAARQRLGEALRLDDSNPRAHLFLGLAHLREGDQARAFEEIKKVTELEPTDMEAKRELELLKRDLKVADQQVQITVLQAMAHLDQGKYDRAIEFCFAALKIKPEHTGALLLLARAMMEQGEPDKAMAHIDTALATDGKNPVVLATRARARVLLGQFVLAARDAEAALRLRPGYPEALREKGMALARSGKKDEARPVLAEAMAALTTDLDIPRVLAGLQLDAGAYEEAIRTADLVLEKSPRDPVVLQVRSSANLALGRNERALRDAERALDGDSDLYGAHLVRATVLLSLGDAQRSLMSARSAARGEATRIPATRLELRALSKLERQEELHRVCNRLLEMIPGDKEALETRGAYHLATGKLGEAVKDYRALTRADPENAKALLGLARALPLDGRPLEAYFTAEKATSKGGGPWAEGVMGWALLVQKKYTGALPHLKTALTRIPRGDPGRHEIRIRLARTFRALGRAEEALSVLKGMSASGEARTEAALLRADLLFDSGDPATAGKVLSLVELQAGEPGSEWFRARRLLLEGKAQTALGVLQALGSKAPGGPAWEDLMRGRCLLKMGRTKDAFARFEDAVGHDPNLSPARLARGRAFLASGRVPEFLTDLDVVVAGNPADGRLRLLRASSAAALPARREQTIDDLDLASRVLPDEPRVFRLRWTLRREAGNLDGALKDLSRLEVLEPGNSQVVRSRAEILETLHRYSLAATAWERALLLKGNADSELKWKSLRALLLAGEYGRCLEGIPRIPSTDPWRAKALLLRCEAELRSGRTDGAIDTAGEVLRLEPKLSLEAKRLRAEAYILRGARTGRGVENEDFVKAYFDIQAYYPRAKRGDSMDRRSRSGVFTVMGLYQLMAEGNP
ncbi:MAG: serine/threonine-protein kinase, partial [Planctomycetota bacterium]